MSFIHIFLVFSVFVAICLLWPLFKNWRTHKKALRQDIRTDARDAIADDRKQELEHTRAAGEISDTEFASLEKDLAMTMAVEDSRSEDGREHPITVGVKSRRLLIIIALLVPVASYLMYMSLGAKADWEISQDSLALQLDPNLSEQDLLALIKKVNRRIDQSPDNSQLIFLLGQLSNQAGDYEESVRAYRRLKDLYPESTDVIGQLAQALFLRAGNIITPEVRENIELALSLDPEMPKALGFAGIDAFQNGRYREAIGYWQSAVKRLDPQSTDSQLLTRGIAQAQIALEQGGEKLEIDDGQSAKKASANKNERIDVNVSLGANVSELSGDETVFVYARAWQGAKMPLAIQRFRVADLPIKISLNKDMAMAQGMDIGSVSQLEVLARVSVSGGVSPQSGDWVASFGPVILGDKPVKVSLLIEDQIP